MKADSIGAHLPDFSVTSAISAVELQRVYRHPTGELKLPFSLFLALRYLKPKRTFLSIITLI